MIPEFNAEGELPVGIHEATLAEIGNRPADNRVRLALTEAQLARLETALAQSRAQLQENDTPLFRAMLEALESQIADLQNELADGSRADAQAALVVSALTEVPQALVNARMVRNLSFSELSQRLNINVAELEAYEASGYRTARFEDVLRIAKVLSVEISGQPMRS